MYKQTSFLTQAFLQRRIGLSPAYRRSCSRLEQQLTALCVAFLLWYYLTMVIAAAATAVLTDVPGTMLLSDVLTSTATRKRLPTGSTC